MNKKPIATLIVASWMLALGGAAHAQSGDGSPMRTASGIEYVTGGVGLQSRQQLAAQAGQYNLQLEFAYGPQGEYLADVQVDITDAKGASVLSTRTDGPWLLAKLPAGTYTVKASFGDVTRTQKVNVGAGKRRLVMVFPASVSKQDVASSPETRPYTAAATAQAGTATTDTTAQ